MDHGLRDLRAHDGSRQFAALAPVCSWRKLELAVATLPGAVVEQFLSGVDEVWLTFTYRGQRFTLHESFGELRCFVDNPAAPEDVLREVLALCAQHSTAPAG